ncbi:MAG TPA: TIGR03118 family protein [Tepidisphaeraceae bacterium]|jgi:uncharacterized protein (TIGR03118 family)
MRLHLITAAASSVIILSVAQLSLAQALPGYTQTNLVSDLASENPAHLDPNLLNPWGISESSGSPFWLADNGDGKSTLYNTSGTQQSTVVSIAGPGGTGTGAPTGTVNNGTSTAFNGDNFLFDTEDGTLYGWRGALGSSAQLLVDNSATGAAYKGLAIATVSGSAYAYGADFTLGRIDVFPGTASNPALTGNFTDPNLPVGYGPFNIQNLGGKLYVTYAKQSGGLDEIDGPGLGVVDVFDTSGNFLQRLVTGGALNGPWGLALAPASFGAAGGDLLVGNFGDGMINVFNPTTGAMVGTLADANSTPIANDGLWALQFGNGGNGGVASTLYLTAGLNGEADGLFASISIPEPASLLLLAALPLCLSRRRI